MTDPLPTWGPKGGFPVWLSRSLAACVFVSGGIFLLLGTIGAGVPGAAGYREGDPGYEHVFYGSLLTIPLAPLFFFARRRWGSIAAVLLGLYVLFPLLGAGRFVAAFFMLVFFGVAAWIGWPVRGSEPTARSAGGALLGTHPNRVGGALLFLALVVAAGVVTGIMEPLWLGPAVVFLILAGRLFLRARRDA